MLAPADADREVVELADRIHADPQPLKDVIGTTSKLVVSTDIVDPEIDSSRPYDGARDRCDDAGDESGGSRRCLRVEDSVCSRRSRGVGSGFRNVSGELRPELQLIVDSALFIAPMDVMMRVFDVSTSKEDFLSSTRRG